jgi:hypothetical protein
MSRLEPKLGSGTISCELLLLRIVRMDDSETQLLK